MTNFSLSHFLWTTVLLSLLVLTGDIHGQERSYPNPLNRQRVDLFFVVDQRPQYMTRSDFVFLKDSISNMASQLNPAGSDPCFGSYFYGPNAAVANPFAFCTKSAASVRTNLDLLVYPVSPSNPTTLTDALNAVKTGCSSSCRGDVSRVTLIISSNIDPSAATLVRQMERDLGMIFVVLSVGSNNNSVAAAQLIASYPQREMTIPVGAYNNLNVFTSYVKSIISDVPRPFPIQSFVSISPAANGIFHSLQINTAAVTAAADAIIMLASNCPRCNTYASLSELIPSDVNSPSFVGRQFYPGTGSYSYLSYFRVPKNTTRVFVSFKGDGTTTAYFTCDVISLPATMVYPQIGSENLLEVTIG